MHIETIEFEFGLTQNVGDYSNVRPSLKIVAKLDEHDDFGDALDELSRAVIDKIHSITDDELESAGMRVKYSGEPLFDVVYSDLRQCVVIAPQGQRDRLPREECWRHSDSWHVVSYQNNRMDSVRRPLAQSAAFAMASAENYKVVEWHDGIAPVALPAFPDPGPEPAWSVKKLKQRFVNIGLGEDEDEMESLAILPHVDSDYLYELYRHDARYKLTRDELIAVIRTNQPWPIATPDEYDDEYDDDDDEEDAEF